MKFFKFIKHIIVALFGITFVVVIHELGHFLTAQWFGVPAPIFSIGFGPPLFSFVIGQTRFQFSLLLLGGYVSLNEAILAAQSYPVKMVITLAGIIVNIVFGLFFMWFLPYIYAADQRHEQSDALKEIKLPQKVRLLFRSAASGGSGFIGPIGIFQLLGKSFNAGYEIYLYLLALISLNIGIFNLLPIMMLDGGHALYYTLELFIPQTAIRTIMTFMYAFIFILFLLYSILNRKST